jgi:hypothetical protein
MNPQIPIHPLDDLNQAGDQSSDQDSITQAVIARLADRRSRVSRSS